MKPLEVWTCQRAENLKKLSKIKKNNEGERRVAGGRRGRRRADQQNSAAPTNCRRRRRGRRTALLLSGVATIQCMCSRCKAPGPTTSSGPQRAPGVRGPDERKATGLYCANPQSSSNYAPSCQTPLSIISRITEA